MERELVIRRVETACALSSVLGVAVMLVGFWPVSGMIPVLSTGSTAPELADFYRSDPGGIRTGLFLALCGLGGYGPLTAVITRHMLRVSPRQATLAYLQLGAGTVGWVFLFLPMLMLSATAYRPDRAPEVTQGMHDMAWFVLVMDFVPFFVQYLAIAAAVFVDRGRVPIFPRWVAYLNIWVAVVFIPTGIITFFKTGPFTYAGLLGFYVPLAVFAVWLVAMPCAVVRAIRAEVLQAGEPAAAGSA